MIVLRAKKVLTSTLLRVNDDIFFAPVYIAQFLDFHGGKMQRTRKVKM